jgi:hypothetical protein
VQISKEYHTRLLKTIEEQREQHAFLSEQILNARQLERTFSAVLDKILQTAIGVPLATRAASNAYYNAGAADPTSQWNFDPMSGDSINRRPTDAERADAQLIALHEGLTSVLARLTATIAVTEYAKSLM